MTDAGKLIHPLGLCKLGLRDIKFGYLTVAFAMITENSCGVHACGILTCDRYPLTRIHSASFLCIGMFSDPLFPRRVSFILLCAVPPYAPSLSVSQVLSIRFLFLRVPCHHFFRSCHAAGCWSQGLGDCGIGRFPCRVVDWWSRRLVYCVILGFLCLVADCWLAGLGDLVAGLAHREQWPCSGTEHRTGCLAAAPHPAPHRRRASGLPYAAHCCERRAH